MNLALHIEKLVLPDLSAGDRRRVVSALEQELARLLREEGVPPQLATSQGTLPLDASQVSIAKDAKTGRDWPADGARDLHQLDARDRMRSARVQPRI